MEELLGYAPGEVTGRSVQLLYPDQASLALARSETARDFRAGRVHMFEHQHLDRFKTINDSLGHLFSQPLEAAAAVRLFRHD